MKVSVTSVAGGPANGATSLTTAIERELVSRGVVVSDSVTVGSCRVEAVVELGPARNGQHSVHIEWTLTDPSGKKLGKVEQYNEVPEGSLDGAWGALARQAAQGIVRLIPR